MSTLILLSIKYESLLTPCGVNITSLFLANPLHCLDNIHLSLGIKDNNILFTIEVARDSIEAKARAVF